MSEEKRDGTLGLLFLTDLRGYDVVSGKLMASALRGFYALLAVFPVLAITLMMGGVSGLQFWKTCLALLNALFISLAAGLFVSTVNADSQKALVRTLVLLFILAAGGPIIDGVIAEARKQPFQAVFSISSPVYCFIEAAAWGQNSFAAGVITNQVIGWAMVGVSCLLAPRTWQEKARSSGARKTWVERLRFGSAATRVTRRNTLLEMNPVLWLACRERWQAVMVWCMTLLLVALLIAALVADDTGATWFLGNYIAGLFTLLLYLLIASHAGRFFVQARRSGLFELILSTPLTVKEIIQGQWRGLRRLFGVALILWLVAAAVGSFMQSRALRAITAGAVTTTAATVATNASGTTVVVVTNSTVTVNPPTGAVASNTAGTNGTMYFLSAFLALLKAVTVLANLVALAWFGMWMGLNSRNTNLATLKTIVFVQIIPWFVVSFGTMMLVPLVIFSQFASSSTAFMIWYPLLTSGLASLLFLLKDAGFVLWSRRKLYAQFRERAGSIIGSLPVAVPRAMAPPLAVKVPPVISQAPQ
jgi:hypothetical protein